MVLYSRMLRSLLEKQKLSLDHFFSTVNVDHLEKVFAKILACQGVVVFAGVGKSGHIAQKISTTFVSTGTRSIFLSPAHALHGDVGFVSSGDVFIAFSKSGESQEMIDLLPFVQKKGAFTIGVVSREDSRLARMSDICIVLPVKEELCPFDLAPTTSTAVQLLFGDCLAIALMQAKQFSVTDFALNHPAGLLGKKIAMKVSDLMLKRSQLPLCKSQDLLVNLLHEISAKKCGCLLVCDDSLQLKGIFTDGDLRRAIQKKGSDALQMPVSMFMTSSPMTTHPCLLVVDAVRKMEENPSRLITVLPVLEEGKVVGLLRMHDVIQSGLH